MPSPPLSIHSADEITPDWLSRLLAGRTPGVRVTSHQMLQTIGGTATKIRLALTYDGDARGLPGTMWLKAGFEAHSDTAHKQAVYLGETLFYRDLAHELDLGPPRAFAAEVDEATGRSYILLEDLTPLDVRFGHATEPLTPEAADRVLALLARLHGRYWGSDALAGLDWLQGGGALIKSGVHDLTFGEAIWSRCLGLPRGALMTGAFADRQGMHQVMSRLLAYDLAHATGLAHGDAQPMNLYFTPDGAPGLLDWQTAMWGHWVHDVAEFVVVALSIEDRRAHERELIARYAGRLAEAGVLLDPDEAWAEYSRHTAYTFHWALCQPEWQPEPVCLANAERACAAIADHDSLAAWR